MYDVDVPYRLFLLHTLNRNLSVRQNQSHLKIYSRFLRIWLGRRLKKIHLFVAAKDLGGVWNGWGFLKNSFWLCCRAFRLQVERLGFSGLVFVCLDFK